MSTLSDAALEYHEQRLSVIPIQSHGKKPLLAGEQFQHRRAIGGEVRSWWARWPDANVGIITGAISGLVVIDLDSEEAKDNFKALLPGYDFTACPRSRTARGWHLFFRHPGVQIPTRAKIMDGVDIRGDGGYIVAPPSVHPSGKEYGWQILMEKKLPEMPSELLDLISSSSMSANIEHTGTEGVKNHRERFDTARALAGVPEGERDEMIFRLACKLRCIDMLYGDAREIILKAAKNCNPPFPESEALQKLENAYCKYAPVLLIWGHIINLGTPYLILDQLLFPSWLLGCRIRPKAISSFSTKRSFPM